MDDVNYITASELMLILEAIDALNGISTTGLESISARFYDSNGEILGVVERANGDGDYAFIPGKA